ncbi:MAG: hypothetical protein ACFB15_00125 [Cyclobacteriaceae bacterium]
MHNLKPVFKLIRQTRRKAPLTLLFLFIVAVACNEQEELVTPEISDTPEINWQFLSEENASIDKIKQWYESEMSSLDENYLRKNKQEPAWFIAEHSSFGKGKSVTAVPLMEKDNESSLKTLYLFEGEEGIKGFVLEQKPDKREDILLTEDFSGEVSLYSLDGKLRTSSELEHGKTTKTKRTSISSRAMSTLRTNDEDWAWTNIMNEVIITGTDESSGGNGFVNMASFEYKPIERVFPGTSYDGRSQGMHHYSVPLSSYSSRHIPLDFEGNGPIVDIREVINCFHQAGSGRNRSVTIYVDQPLEGMPSRWNIYNAKTKVGHTFVKLSMETYDGRKIEKIVGYYPKNSSVNPIASDHTDEGVFRNDNNRRYDVSVTINNVSPYNFSRVMSYLERMHNTTYNLNSQNCTDIGLEVAKRAGRTLPDPQVTWPFGGGSAPGPLGEVLRNHSCSSCTIDDEGGRAYSEYASGGGC